MIQLLTLYISPKWNENSVPLMIIVEMEQPILKNIKQRTRTGFEISIDFHGMSFTWNITLWKLTNKLQQ